MTAHPQMRFANGHANCAIKQMVNRCNARIDLPDMADEVILSGVPWTRASQHLIARCLNVFRHRGKGETLVLERFSEVKISERRASAGV